MGLPSRFHDHARRRHVPHRRDDPGTAPPRLCKLRRGGPAYGLILACLCALAAQADTLRIATWNVELTRKGPGILLRDLIRNEDPQITAILGILSETSPDILLVQGFDYDLTGAALSRFAEAAGYPHHFAAAPNSGRQTGLDVDGDERLGEPEDALGFGRFFGEGGMALLSRYPVRAEAVQDFSYLLWRDMPDTLLPAPNADWPAETVHAALPLSAIAHWSVPVETPNGLLTLLAFHANPPVFDGPEDRNGKRNHDQIVFWQHLMDGRVGTAPARPFVLFGNANQDPVEGEGRKDAIRGLLADPRLQDPKPASAMGTDTVDWTAIGVGRLRVSYILPAAGLKVTAAGVHWPEPDSPQAIRAETASRHRLVWIDLDLTAGD